MINTVNLIRVLGIALLVVGGGGLLFVGLPMWIFHRNRERLSRWMDRNEVRPSRVSGFIELGIALAGLTLLLMLPVYGFFLTWFTGAFMAIGALGLAIRFGFGVEGIVHKPPAEFRPTWYVGDGNPTWKNPLKDPRSRSLSLTWFVAVVFACCIVFARYSFVLKHIRDEDQRYDRAYQAAIDLGATIKNGSLSFGGLSHVTDEDLTFLEDLMNVPFRTNRQRFHDLNLSQTAITNETLKRVAKIKSLQSLFLTGTEIDDEGLQQLVGQCPHLRMLFLENTNATGKVLPLAPTNGRSICVLQMSGCPIDADGRKNIHKVTQGAGLLQLDIDNAVAPKAKRSVP